MNIVESLVRNPVKVSVGVLLVVLFGTVAMTKLPMQLTPEVETPTLTITTRWPGASPAEVEQEIVIEQEDQLKGVEGVQKMSSESKDSSGEITLEFAVGEDMDSALAKVTSALSQVPEYPEDVDLPVVSSANSSSRPIAWFILSVLPADDAAIQAFAEAHPALKSQLARIKATTNIGLRMYRLRELAAEHPEATALLPPEDLKVDQLKRFAEDELADRFKNVDGVAQSNVIGGLEEELQVIVDMERLAARQVTLTALRDVLRLENKNTSAGDIWDGKNRYVVRLDGRFDSPQRVLELPLAVRDGAPVYVRDVADVRFGFKKPDGLVRRYGEENIAVNVVRETGANVIDVMTGLHEVNDYLNTEILNPKGLTLAQVYDETDYIESSVNLVQQNIFVGGALTMVVLMAFLHLGFRTLMVAPLVLATAVASVYVSPWWFVVSLALMVGAGLWFARGALVVGLAIPVSIIGTFLVLQGLGRSLNVISLAGMAFAVGMLVDNAVVVLENIYRRYTSLGESPLVASVRGTQEVWGAVLSSTLTTIAVFLPVVFVEEEAGQLFRDIALAISAAVGLSLVVSVTLIPTAASRLFKQHRSTGPDGKPAEEPRPPATARALNRVGGGLIGSVVAVNRWAQGGVLRKLATVVLLIGLAVGLSWSLWPRVEYLPTGNRNLVIGFVVPPPGYNINQLLELGRTVEAELKPYWDVEPGVNVKDLDAPGIYDYFFVVRGRSVFMGVRALDPLRSGELVDLLSPALRKSPGAFGIAKQTSLFENGLSAGRTVDIEITGPKVEKLVGIGGQMFGTLRPTDPTSPYFGWQVLPKPSLDLSSPELHVTTKSLNARAVEMPAQDLGFAVNVIVDGAYVSDYYQGGKKIDLTVMSEGRFADRTQRLDSAPIATPDGQLVPLSAVADIAYGSGPEQINHREKVRSVTLQVTPPENVALEDAMQRIDEEIVAPLRASGQLEGGYRIALAGTADKLSETWKALRFNVMLALLITYLLMAALFESWMYPLIIILSVPLGAAGGVLGLWVLNLFVLQPLDVLTMLGFVVLIGTVVNNPILIVHQSLIHLREDGMTPRDAILESVRTRIRPIFMTTTTTVLGLLPLVLFPGAGSELYRGIGSVVLGGLIVSTIFTLLLVPTLFSLLLEILPPSVQEDHQGSAPRRLPEEMMRRPSPAESFVG
ncbi:Multidrug resistance protein MdtC [Posidoniimonas polymericola]|uniref:Multidrug resistance protein MdtC n=1 Tax=Posidoniimonas polymericola TaxID=2528002 RepID=A0A5C5XZB7_9BACT|nr:efflux RND transporter permease subunit [Posidoniimonas polymericola]TWT66832.1 Multidrug resistance protein MdtC [Posidoniimonas polymericola]